MLGIDTGVLAIGLARVTRDRLFASSLYAYLLVATYLTASSTMFLVLRAINAGCAATSQPLLTNGKTIRVVNALIALSTLTITRLAVVVIVTRSVATSQTEKTKKQQEGA